ncbi:DUF2625 domain-containing protein [Streptomyces sp. NBC_00667]|nr:DUF2625 domain-containing protein [Streptomyces sp. NBC_00539]
MSGLTGSRGAWARLPAQCPRPDGGWLRVFGSPARGAAHGVPGLARAKRFPDDIAPRALNGDQGLSSFPPLWSAEARQDISAVSRRAVPMAEVLGLARDSCHQFDGVDPGLLGAV